ncbi:MAG: aminomethyl transferase family protein, partial [Burkholderiales bacterium]
FHLQGPDALQFFSDVSVNGFSGYEVGQAKHLSLCNERGKLMGEGILMRLAGDEFLFTSGPGVPWVAYRHEQGGYRSRATLFGAEHFIVQVQGPASLYLLEQVCGESLRDIGFMRFRRARIGDMAFDLLRQGMAGELGYELHGRGDDAQAIHQSILDAGRGFGIRRLGGRTKMVNHVEACFPTPSVDYLPALYGPDQQPYHDWCGKHFRSMVTARPSTAGSLRFDDLSALTRSPVELGWAKSIRCDHAFTGRAALEAELASPRRKMVTLVWNSEDVIDVYASLFRDGEPYEPMEMPRNLLGCMHVDDVLDGDQSVGASTSRCYSHSFRQMLSLCTIDVARGEPGTPVTVVWGAPGRPQKRVRATVAPAPYKRDNRRIDVAALPARFGR